MRVLFSIYYEDIYTGERTLHFSQLIETDINLEQINSHLNMHDRFHSVVAGGQKLVFWDVYCFDKDTANVINKVKTIRVCNGMEYDEEDPQYLIIEKFAPECDYPPSYSSAEKYYFFKFSRFECGASGGSVIIATILQDPILSGLISSFIFEFLKKIVSQLYNYFYKCNKSQNKNLIKFNVKRFYQEFKKMTNNNRKNCQIVDFEKLKKDKYKILVRTTKNESYEVISDSNGTIKSMHLLELQ